MNVILVRLRKFVKSGRMERAGLRKDTKSRGQKQTFMFDYAETEYLRRQPKIRISRGQKQIYLRFCRGEVSSAQPKIRKVERRSKRQLDYAETKYLRRQPKYE